MAFRLGIDLGGTKIEAVIIDEQFQVVKRKRVPTNREEGYEAIIETIISLSKSMKSMCRQAQIAKSTYLVSSEREYEHVSLVPTERPQKYHKTAF